MEWITIQDRSNARKELPKDQQFLALWKGTFALCEFDVEEDHFYIGFMPTVYEGFFKLAKEREAKFTHYCKLNIPKGY